MKKGSRAIKCKICGDIIFWRIPDGNLMGIPLVKDKRVKPYTHSKKLRGYVCKECLEKRKDVI